MLAERDAATTRPDEEIEAEMRQRITSGSNLIPREIRIVDSGTLPRTASGKLRRSEVLRLYQAGTLTAPKKVNALLMQ